MHVQQIALSFSIHPTAARMGSCRLLTHKQPAAALMPASLFLPQAAIC